MKNGGVVPHRASSSGLFCAFCLLAVALGLAGARPLSLAMGGSLLSLFLFTRPGLRSALGEFLAPLAIVVDLALLFCAMSLTGGAGSPYALLLPAGLALAWFQLGRGAAWFFAAASLLGVAALVILGREPLSDPAHAFPLLLAALAAPSPRVRRAARISSRSWARSRPRTGSPTAAGCASSSSRKGRSFPSRPIRSRCSAPSATCSRMRSSTRRRAARSGSARAPRG